MELLAGKELWPVIQELASRSTRRWIAVSYVSQASPLSMRQGDLAVVNASNESVLSGATSAHELLRLYETGVRLYSKSNLHAKLYLFDDDLVVGSSNLSQSSQRSLFETAGRTRSAEACSAAQQLIEDLIKTSIPIDRTFLERILSLPVAERDGELVVAQLFRLKYPPVPAIGLAMKCYFHALIEAQLGGLVEGIDFSLWRGPAGTEAFRAHMRPEAHRLRGGAGRYVLTREGVEYFGVRKLDVIIVGQFLAAIRSGRSEDLPASLDNRDLVPL